MRIAFTSCFFTRVLADQPVWDQIRALKPDWLVLLGDAYYLDLKTATHPRDMTELEFAEHQHALIRELLAQPQFKALLASLPKCRVQAVWDDHDCLWNDVVCDDVHPVHSGKLRVSTAMFEALRRALANRGAGFPASALDAQFWNPEQPPLSTPSLALGGARGSVHLHLPDGRSFRTRTWLVEESRRHLFGAAQRQRFSAAIGAQPKGIHLWASGSTVGGYERYRNDRQWLLDLAAQQRMLVLSGDIHYNRFDAFHTGGWPLHEATASGAAVKDAVIVGRTLQNFGLLDIEPQRLRLTLYKHGKACDTRTLRRDTWLPEG